MRGKSSNRRMPSGSQIHNPSEFISSTKNQVPCQSRAGNSPNKTGSRWIPHSIQTYIHAVNGEQVLWRDSVPGNGNRPAHDWQTGETWTERYIVRLPETLAPGTQFILVAGLYDPATGTAYEAFDGAGNGLSNTPGIGTLTIVDKPTD